MRRLAQIAFAFVAYTCAVTASASQPGQPLDCSDWVFVEPGYTCVRVFGGTERVGNLTALQADNTGRLFRFGAPSVVGACGSGSSTAAIYRHPMEFRQGDTWALFAYVDDRCDPATSPSSADRFHPSPASSPEGPFPPALSFDATGGRMLVYAVSEGSNCPGYPTGCGDYWVASISGFATTFEVLQTYVPQPASVAFRVPYMPEGLPAADHFDTYWGPLAHPIDFTQAHPLQCGYPAMSPHVGDYLTVNDALPTPQPRSGYYYVTSATYQGQTRYGRKATAGHLSGRDPALLPACAAPVGAP